MNELMHGLSRDDEDRQEIRLALVMTGGVSLAVWMGGVAGEIYRATHFDGLYGELLDLTACSARVDVLAGTSAGGLNGALLAAAIAGRATPEEFFEIRDLWFAKASMLEMMRSPFKRDPPSLLRGDEYFLPELESAFARLLKGANGGKRAGRIHLHVTGTLRKGRLLGFADDFGEVISEVDHRGSFTFRRDGQRDDFTGVEAAAALALAARSSASFPIAFEASFVPVRQEHEEEPRERANLIKIANFDKDRFVIDGGVLLNKPIEPALKAIFEQPTERHVRRVLAYVVPDPGEPVEPQPDKPDELPSLTELAWDSLVRLPRVQLVADDLAELRDRNVRVQRRIQLRELLLAGDRSEGFIELAQDFFDLYRSKAAERSVGEMLSRIAQSVGRRQPSLEGERDWDRPALRRALVEARAGWLPREFPGPGNVRGDSGRAWDWGIASLESACLAVIDLFRRAAYLMPFVSGKDDPGLEGLMVDRELLLSRHAELRQRRGQLQLMLDRLRLINELGEGYWDWKLVQARTLADDPERLGAWAHEAYCNWLHQPGLHEEGRQEPLKRMQDTLTNLRTLDPSWPERRVELDQSGALTSLRQLGDDLAEIVVDAAPLFREVATVSRRVEARRYGLREDDSGAPERSPQQVLLRMVKSLVPVDEPDRERQRVECLRRLLALHVAELLLGDRAVLEQPVAFIRISGEAPNDFDPGRKTAAQKLAGIQLGHFGAFFKRSWRANDWMWGRLDGAVRLALVLLNPSRLRQLGYTSTAAYEELYRISRARGRDGDPILDREGNRMLEEDDECFLVDLWNQDRERIESELAFLARPPDPAAPDPESLRTCARAVARTIQVGILKDELPVVADAISMSREEGAAAGSAARDFCGALEQARDNPGKRLSARKATQLLGKCQIGKERITGELGHDALTATATGAAATAVAAAGGARSGLGPMRAFAAVLRTATLAVYVLVQSALRGSKTGFALTTVALALAGSIVALRLLGVEGIPGGVLTVAVALLVVWALWTGLRAHAWGLLVAGIAALLAAAALYGENVANALVRSERSGAVNWADEHPGTLAGVVALAATAVLWLLFRGTTPRWHRWLGRGFAVAAVVPLAIGLTAPMDDFLDWLQSDTRTLSGWREQLLSASARLEDHQALVVLCTLVLVAVALNIMSRGVRAWARSI